jgi:putative cardiolipin synthase
MPFPRPSIPLLLAFTATPACVSTIEDAELPRVPSHALPPAADSALGRIFGAPASGDPSGFVPLDRGDEGLDVRLALSEAAESSIDAQSYLWHEDACGSLLLDRLLAAADRGVRVRLLIDGFKLEGHEALDEALDLHPELEIRVFNPTLHRGGIWQKLELAENLERLDHRMHNKLFLADGVAGVFGGRNVGDEYFGLGEEADLRDFDLLARGPVVEELAASFDEFWNGRWSVPLTDLLAPIPEDERRETHARAREQLSSLHAGDRRLDARRAQSEQDWIAALGRARERMVPGHALVLHDAAAIEAQGATGVLGHAFERALASTSGDVLIVTAYLVPDETFLEHVRAHVEAGQSVRILTNSYGSTNQPLVHTFYAPSRHDLLLAGVELYELRGDAWSHVHHRSPGSGARKLGLHAKSAVFGDEHVLIGSMNVDPRSMELNTELGVLIESRELAAWVRSCLERELSARNAWRVELDEGGGLRWTTLGAELDEEPRMDGDEHAREWFLRLLPLRGEV